MDLREHGVVVEGSEAVVFGQAPGESVAEADADGLAKRRDVAALRLVVPVTIAAPIAAPVLAPVATSVPAPVAAPVPASVPFALVASGPVVVPPPGPPVSVTPIVAVSVAPPALHLPKHPEQLLPNVPGELHPAVAQTVPLAKIPSVPAPLPRLVRPHQHNVVPHPLLVIRAQRLDGLLTLLHPRRPAPRVHPLDAQHRRDGGHLVDAFEPPRREHRPGELRLHGQRRHLATERRHGPVLVDRAQRVQLSQRIPHEFQIGFIQKVKVEDVQSFQAQGFEVENRSHE
mmetsp:Transcript_10872/g.50212  ORF Transcript_10872/g.50212 Transcript_10872/m.50212 type:complete len:286 (+) Transcript_10872:445-1302(+)